MHQENKQALVLPLHPCNLTAHFGTSTPAACPLFAVSKYTTFSPSARMFPSATDKCIRCYRLRYLLSIVGGYVFVGQLSYIRRYCPCGHFVHAGSRLPHSSLLTFFTKIATDFAEFTKCLYLICRHFWKLPVRTSCQDGTKLGGENKKDPYLHTRITGNTKKRTAHVR